MSQWTKIYKTNSYCAAYKGPWIRIWQPKKMFYMELPYSTLVGIMQRLEKRCAERQRAEGKDQQP